MPCTCPGRCEAHPFNVAASVQRSVHLDGPMPIRVAQLMGYLEEFNPDWPVAIVANAPDARRTISGSITAVTEGSGLIVIVADIR